jgi:hypothetical protein
LRALGYEGGYDAVRRYARTRRRETKRSIDAYIPLTFAPGEAYQFDWRRPARRHAPPCKKMAARA